MGEAKASQGGPELDLHAGALTGWRARLADLALIAAMTTVVLLAHWLGDAELYLPLAALACGALGVLAAGPGIIGMLPSRRYPLVYFGCIAVMVAVDLGVRMWLGGSLAAVFSNWAVLIGSASAVNLLVLRIPWLSSLRWIDEEGSATMHPVAFVIAVVVQVLQMGISVLGAPWPAILVQLLARRVAILPLTHLIARAHYGEDASARLRARETFEYLATRSISDGQGRVVAKEPLEQVVVGAALLRLPMLAGEPMNAGRHSLARLGDKLVFVEQMLAFSSPTFVVSRPIAAFHLSFIMTLLGAGEGSEEGAEEGVEQVGRVEDRRRVAAALRGDWGGFR